MSLPASRHALAWRVTCLLGAALGLRLWDLLLLKRFLDQPARVAAWLAVAGAVAALAWQMARATPPWRRSRPQRALARVGRAEIALALLFALLLFALHWGYQRARSDGREYFVQVRSLLIDHDLEFANENATFGVRGSASIYPFGAALLWSPFFAAAHGWLGLLDALGADYPRDGFFNPYQRAVGLGSFLYGCLGLLLAYDLSRRRFGAGLAAAAVILVCLGSFLAWYLAVDPSMPHALSFATVALFVWLWDRTRTGRTARHWLLLGAAAGLMTIVRWQNLGYGVLLLPDVFAAARAAWRRRQRLRRRRDARSLVTIASPLAGPLLAAVAAAAVFSPQLLFWKLTRGGWLAVPAGAHAFYLGRWRDVLFTPDHGLFTWSPLLAFALFGFLLFGRREPRLALPLLAAFAFQVVVLMSVGSPGYGFGARRLASAAVIYVLGTAALAELLLRRPRWMLASLAAVVVLLNGLFALEVRSGRLPGAGDLRSWQIADALLRRTGHPMALPASLWFSWRYGTDLGHYERLGTQSFANLRLDLGSGGDERFLVRGWGAAERQGALRFRWSDGAESVLLARLRFDGPYRLVLQAAPLLLPDRRPQFVTVEINGHAEGRLRLQPGLHRYELPVSGTRVGVNRLVLRYAWNAAPKEFSDSPDARRLAVQFDRLELLLSAGRAQE